MSKLFQFSVQTQQVIMAHIKEVEDDTGIGELSICELFENDDLYYIATDDECDNMPTNLTEIDWSFTNRQLHIERD